MNYSRFGKKGGNHKIDFDIEQPMLEEDIDIFFDHENETEVLFEAEKLLRIFKYIVLLWFDLKIGDVTENAPKVKDIGKRIIQRKAYYHYFHGYDIDQLKQAAIRSYWILKYKPFGYSENASVNKTFIPFELNSLLAFCCLWIEAMAAVNLKLQNGTLKSRDNKVLRIDYFKDLPSNDLLGLYLHTFSECDCSKEVDLNTA